MAAIYIVNNFINTQSGIKHLTDNFATAIPFRYKAHNGVYKALVVRKEMYVGVITFAPHGDEGRGITFTKLDRKFFASKNSFIYKDDTFIKQTTYTSR